VDIIPVGTVMQKKVSVYVCYSEHNFLTVSNKLGNL